MKVSHFLASVCVFLSLRACEGVVQTFKYSVTSAGCDWASANCTTSYHCIDTVAGVVQGSAGFVFVFSGTLAGQQATVNWVLGSGVTGRLTWTYSADFLTISGITALSGAVPPIAAAFTAGQVAPATISPQAYCLWVPPSSSGNGIGTFNHGNGVETHCNLSSTFFGSYQYDYHDGTDLELGVLFGSFVWGDSSTQVMTWTANTGPYMNVSGYQINRMSLVNGVNTFHGFFTNIDVYGNRTFGDMVGGVRSSTDQVRNTSLACMHLTAPAFSSVTTFTSQKPSEYWKGTASGLAVAFGFAVVVAIVVSLVLVLGKRAPSPVPLAKVTSNPLH